MGPGLSSVLCWWTGRDPNPNHFAVELPKQLRVPQESHLRKLLTAAHTYSQNWSRITSISASNRPLQRATVLVALPSRRGFDSRVTVGRGMGRDLRRPWDTGL